MDVKELKKRINNIIDDWASSLEGSGLPQEQINLVPIEGETPGPEKPKNGRVVRTRTSGDRVYFIDEEKKIRRWITNPEILKKLGFDMKDVTEVDDTELLKYQMGPALYRVDA